MQGEICAMGMCTLSCPQGQTDCSGVCKELSHDPNNCGACNTVCKTDEACKASACVKIAAKSCSWPANLTNITIPNSTFGLGQMSFDDNCDIITVSYNSQPHLQRVSRVNGQVTTITANIASLLSVVYRPADNNYYVGDTAGRIYRVTKAGVSTMLVDLGTSLNTMRIAPTGFGNFGGLIITGDSSGNVKAFDPSNNMATLIAKPSSLVSDLEFGIDGTLYTISSGTIHTVTAAGAVVNFATVSGGDGLVADPDGSRLLIADSASDDLEQLTLPGKVNTKLGDHNFDSGFFISGMLHDNGNNLIMALGETSRTLVVIQP